MATTENMMEENNQSASVIDPIYEKFSKNVVRALASTEFYEFFMDSLSRAHNRIQFSNRKVEKIVDLTWVDAIDEALEGFQNIISNPRNRILEEELIVNVAHAKKAGSDVVRHLAQHGSLVEDFDETSGEVRPSKLMQKYREDSTEMYENRVAFTVLEHAFHFVKIRHDALFDSMHEEYGAKLKVESKMESATELLHVDTFVHVKNKDSALETDEKNRDIFAKIDRLYRLLGSFMNTDFAEQLKKTNRVKGTITKTNVLKKNPDYKKIVKLWEFLRKYDDVGYLIKVTEQNPEINEQFQQDIFHNIMFQYIVLKGYLEDEADRAIPTALKTRKRKLKPKVIKSIIEELTEDYDIPDVEIRKVLIEELTKEQLMLEEESERRRLVEEALERKRIEEEVRNELEEKERQRLKREEEAEAERIRLEKEAEEKEKLQIRMEMEIEDRRRTGLFLKDIQLFESKKNAKLMARSEEAEMLASLGEKKDFANAARKQEELEAKQKEKEALERKRQAEAEEKARKMEEERAEKLRMQELAARKAEDMKLIAIYVNEASYFAENLQGQKKARLNLEEELRLEQENLERERQLRHERKLAGAKKAGKRRNSK